jgi:hypothetical protein
VADGYGKAIWKIDPAGKPTKFAEGPPLDNPVGIAWQGDKLLVVDPRAKSVFEIAKDGKLTTVVSSPLPKPPAPPAKVEKPAAKSDKKSEKKDK